MDETSYYVYLDDAPHSADVLTTLAAAERRADAFLDHPDSRLRQVQVAQGHPEDRPEQHRLLRVRKRDGVWRDWVESSLAPPGRRQRLSPLAARVV